MQKNLGKFGFHAIMSHQKPLGGAHEAYSFSFVDGDGCNVGIFFSPSRILRRFPDWAIECLPQCATAHYFAAFAQLRIKGDKNYAKQKCELLQSFNSEMANTLVRKLKAEIERIKVRS
jgi:hypothetical protein